jgi:hypothetical protein
LSTAGRRSPARIRLKEKDAEMIAVLRFVAGIGLLVLGRKLFWLFVGGIGFVAALALAARFFGSMPEWLQILLALGVGLVGALVAVFLQKAAIGVAGFLGGGLILGGLLGLLGVDLAGAAWFVVFVIGGVLGVILVAAAFEWALILLSSLAGASILVEALSLSRPVELMLFLGALAAGIVIQVAIKRGEKAGEG